MHSAIFRLPVIHAHKAWPLAIMLGLAGCGYQSQDQSKLKDESTVSSFSSWCESWTILCDSEPAPNPSPVELNADTWNAVTKIANEALANKVAFSVTRTEIDSPDLALAFNKLGLDSELTKIKTSLDSKQWQSIGLEGKSLVGHAADVSSATASNGLSLNAAAAVSVSLGDNSTIKVDGVSLSSEPAGKTSELKTISLGQGNTLNFGLASETVQNVPFPFLEKTLVSASGFENEVSEPVEFTAAQIIGAAYPLLSWANKPQRTISLNRKFFSVASTELAPLVANESFGPALLNALSALNSFDISATAGQNLVQASQVSGAKLECNVNSGAAKVVLDKDFGVKRFYQVNGGVGLEFFGVKASAKLALGIPLTLKRVEIRETKITILDIPIIGKVDVNLDDITSGSGGAGSEETTLACVK